jgi:hypothetical protein
VLNRNFDIAWKQQWKRRLSTTLGVHIGQTEFGGSNRSDENRNLNLAVNYDWRKWLSFTMGLQLMQRDSTEDTSDFDRMIWLIGLRMAI